MRRAFDPYNIMTDTNSNDLQYEQLRRILFDSPFRVRRCWCWMGFGPHRAGGAYGVCFSEAYLETAAQDLLYRRILPTYFSQTLLNLHWQGVPTPI